jgi:uncharacterized protein with GYD domain
MAKYLVHVTYTAQGLQGVAAKGGTAREKAARAAAESLGGSIDSFYFTFGDSDVIVIADFPDNASAAALALAVGASGGASARTTVLLSAADVDNAAKKQVSYQPPGS